MSGDNAEDGQHHEWTGAHSVVRHQHQNQVSRLVDIHWGHHPQCMILINDNDNCIERCNSRFFTVSSLRCTPSPTCTLKWPRRSHMQIMCNSSSAYHVQHVMLRAMWYKGTAHLLSLTEFISHFILAFILLAEPLTDEGGGGNRSTWRKPLVVSFRKCHTLKPEGSNPKRDSSPQDIIGDRLGKQTC